MANDLLTYRPGDPVRIEVNLRDDSGIAYARFKL
jgi:hypothetical protein